MHTTYTKKFIDGDPQYRYEDRFHIMFFSKPLCVKDFIDFLKVKNIKTVLEVGCSVGMFPRTFHDVCENMEYTGMDILSKCVEICKSNMELEFLCGDFIKFKSEKKFDLVYSFDVIDHVCDIDGFISNIVDVTKKYAYVNAYREDFILI